MANTVRDNRSLHRFELDVDGHIAFAEYRRTPGLITFVHTVVPPELGGRGVGTTLAQGALGLVRAEGLKVAAECPFIAGFLKKHPEFNDLLARPAG
ncbi:MAG TPA: GNAT family N-acetyltransferase [Candidatus Cybelea sp.]|nr:GNAT family N-acetyltransferase [Candidatus Cybelea sp.]